MEGTICAAWIIIVGVARIANLILIIIQMRRKKELDAA